MRSRALTAMLVIAAACITGGWLVQRGHTAAAVNGARLFDQVRARISAQYVDTLSDTTLYRRAIDGMLRELGDPHSRYLTGLRLHQLQESTTGKYEGIGIRIDVRDEWITVVAPLPGTPAERAGVMTGDRIVEIEGKNTHGWSSDDAAQAIRGAPGSRVSFVVERPGVAARIPFRVERREVRVRSVPRVTMLRDSVGYVDVDVFSETTADEMERAVETLMGRGMRVLTIDLRGNPGGLLDQGVQVADLFLDAGQVIVGMKGRVRDANRSYTDRRTQRWPSLPIVVLIDSGSASASEIVAGALQDHDRALVIGTTSYGKGSAQSLYAVGDSTALKLTTARWFTPIGRSIDRAAADTSDDEGDTSRVKRPEFRTDGGRTILGGGGITPDLEVGETSLTEQDRQFERALGQKLPQFRGALTSYALELRGRGGVSASFDVTPAMRSELWARMRARGIEMPREIFDAAPVVDRLLVVEIARYVFGDLQGFLRASATDRAIQTTLQIAVGARTQQQLFERARERRTAGSADAGPARAYGRSYPTG